MEEKFCDDNARLLYNRIVKINEELVKDSKSKLFKRSIIRNKGSLLDLCNSIYTTKPFTQPPEPYCSDFAEMTAMIIFRLNKGHCFVDGNKRTILLIIMELIKDVYPVFYNDFFKGGLSIFLKDMIEKSLNQEQVLEWVRNQYNLEHEISDEVNYIIHIIMQYKRIGHYDEAIKMYQDVLNKYGPSVALYKSVAKVLTCKGEYEQAIELYEQAIMMCNEYIDEFELYNLERHKNKLLKRNEMSKKDFLEYLKAVSGNPNYSL